MRHNAHYEVRVTVRFLIVAVAGILRDCKDMPPQSTPNSRRGRPMSIQEVREAILKVQPHVMAFDPGPSRNFNPDAPANNHETSTRYLIIDPIQVPGVGPY